MASPRSYAPEAVAKGNQAQNKLRSVISAKAEIHCSWWIPTFVGMTIVAHFDSYTLLRQPRRQESTTKDKDLSPV